jgi:hypothetical protein
MYSIYRRLHINTDPKFATDFKESCAELHITMMDVFRVAMEKTIEKAKLEKAKSK